MKKKKWISHIYSFIGGLICFFIATFFQEDREKIFDTGEKILSSAEKIEAYQEALKADLLKEKSLKKVKKTETLYSNIALPKKGVKVSLEEIQKICIKLDLNDLWEKIEKDPPPRPFASDGCSMWFDKWQGIDLYPAAFLHDLKYWAGYPGESVERLIADSELMMDVARLLGSTPMAETMFHGVRLGGNSEFHQSFSWGFGRQEKK